MSTQVQRLVALIAALSVTAVLAVVVAQRRHRIAAGVAACTTAERAGRSISRLRKHFAAGARSAAHAN